MGGMWPQLTCLVNLLTYSVASRASERKALRLPRDSIIISKDATRIDTISSTSATQSPPFPSTDSYTVWISHPIAKLYVHLKMKTACLNHQLPHS